MAVYRSIVIPESVISIGDTAFFACDALISVSLPYSLRIIGNASFSSSGLTYVNYNGTSENKEEIVFGEDNNVLLDAVWYYSDGTQDEGSDIITSGNLGEGITWQLSRDNTCTVSGNGNIDRSSISSEEDNEFQSIVGQIRNVIIEEGITGINDLLTQLPIQVLQLLQM